MDRWPSKLKTIAQILKKGGFEIIGKVKGSDMVGWEYIGPFDDLEAQSIPGGYHSNNSLADKGQSDWSASSCGSGKII